MAQIEKCMVDRERMKRSSRCMDQLSNSMDKTSGIKDLSWGIERKFLRPSQIRSGSNGMAKGKNLHNWNCLI
jgi:hypothetical protein